MICSIDGCENVFHARSWCAKHYARWKRHGDPTYLIPKAAVICSLENCTSDTYAKGWCYTHYWKNYRHGDPEYQGPIRYKADRVCSECGGRTSHGNMKYCGEKCREIVRQRKFEDSKAQWYSKLTIDSGIRSGHLRKVCFRFSFLSPQCSICGLTEWMGKSGEDAPLQLDHINGINTDNRLENLRILCANCHTQTDTFCGKNIGNTSK